MNFKKEYKKRYVDRFGIKFVNGMKLKKWLSEQKDIVDYLNKINEAEQRYGNFSNVLWCFIHDFDINEYKCKVCGKLLTLKHPTQLKKYCSTKCAMNDPDLINKRKETISKDKDYWKRRTIKRKKTSLERYGVEIASKAESVKQKIRDTINKDPLHWQKRNDKAKQTCLKRYGVENASSMKFVREKVIKTNLERYGVTNANKLPETLEKVKKTCLQKYGVDCQFKRREVHEWNLKKVWNRILNWKDYVIPLFTFDEYKGKYKKQAYKWKCVKCRRRI